MTTLFRSLPALVALNISLGAAPNTPPQPNARAQAVLAKLPLQFEANRGQAAKGFDFLARGAGYRLLVGRARASIVSKSGRVGLRLDGVADGPGQGEKELPGKINYLIGRDESRWVTDVPAYERVSYDDVYPGVRLVYYGNHGELEYDFDIAAGADPNRIRMTVDGATPRIDASGDLRIGPFRLKRPLSYQAVGGARREVSCRWVVEAGGEVRFAVGGYDRARPLVIDPSLVYSTFLGGGSGFLIQTNAFAIAVDSSGAAYVAGQTYGDDFPLQGPEQSSYAGSSAMFVTKLAADGRSLIYSTYLGGSSSDQVSGIAVDSNGNAQITGSTTSTDFPLKNALYSTLAPGDTDAFVVKLTIAGDALVYSTYLGGSSTDNGLGIGVDGALNTYVGGYTCSTDFPVTSGAYQTSHSGCDSFVTKLNPSGSALVYSTYFGDNDSAYADSFAVSPGDTAFLAGKTCSNSFPVTAGAAQVAYGGGCDGFVARFNRAGSQLLYATYLGGSQYDYVNSIALDSSSNAYVTGSTTSADFPVTPGAFQTHAQGGEDGFVARLNSAGSTWIYATYLGGFRDDYPASIAVDASQRAAVTGYTYSTNFPSVSALEPKSGQLNTIGLFQTRNAGASWNAADGTLPGEVTAISLNPSNAANIVATTSANVFYTNNGGASWTASNLSQQYVTSLARSPVNSNVIYAITYLSPSVFSSSDGGQTWAFAGKTPTPEGGLVADPLVTGTVYAISSNISISTDSCVSWTSLTDPVGSSDWIYNLAIDPTATTTLYAATSTGLYKSTDSGASWSQLGMSAFGADQVSQVLVNPKNPAVLYAVVNSNIWKSINRGAAWVQETTGINGGINSLALAPSAPGVLYALDSSGNVYVSTNGGANWALTSSFLSVGLGELVVSPTNQARAFLTASLLPTGFVAKINPAGRSVAYSTYLGGFSVDFVSPVTIGPSGNAYVTGSAHSGDFPTTPGVFQTGDGNPNLGRAFITQIADATSACSFTATPASYFVYGSGGSGYFSVVSPSGCAWTPSTTDSWLHVTHSGNSGVGPMDITADANPGAARVGTVTAGGSTVTINEAAGGCSYSLSSYPPPFPAAGGSVNIDITAGAGCDWNVTQLPGWLTATPVSGTGNGAVTLQAAASLFPNTRYGYPIIAASTAQVTQTGTTGIVTPPPAKLKCPPGQPGFCPGQPPMLPPAVYRERMPTRNTAR